MSIEDLISTAARYDTLLLACFAALPLLVPVLWVLHGRHGAANSPWKYVYTLVVYASCIPGIFALVLSGYTLFFLRASLLTVNALIYFLPVLSMAITLVLIRKRITFDAIPGFNRLQGLLLLLVCTFVIALILDRLRIFLMFRGSFVGFLLLCLIIFILLKIAVRLLLGAFSRG